MNKVDDVAAFFKLTVKGEFSFSFSNINTKPL